MSAIYIGFLAFLAEGIGVAIGIMLLCLFHIKDKRLLGMLFGGTSGIMIAMICFDILPEAMSFNNNWLVLLGIASGLLMGLLLEDFVAIVVKKMKVQNKGTIGTGIVLVIGIALHNIPEGFAIGTLALTAPDTIMKFLIVVCIHSIPEAIALAIPLCFAKTSRKTLCMIPIMLAGIMGVGAIAGYLLSQVAAGLIAFALGGAAGIVLYIVCDELLPESRKIWNGRMTTVATIIGLVIGMFMMG
ncbi:MAG: ZIP family metal transporter [Cellulosilyticaceae bacterium]